MLHPDVQGKTPCYTQTCKVFEFQRVGKCRSEGPTCMAGMPAELEL